MKYVLVAAFALAACATLPAADAPAPELRVEPYTFTARDGRSVEAEIGRFSVPENRASPGGRQIELAFVRFPSTLSNPGNPIVYLAGGPGGSGSGTARGARFDIFMALREQGDVIAFDQRGTGLSNSLPVCEGQAAFTPDTPLTRETIVAATRAETARCLEWWRGEGVDVGAYNTRESAEDIEALRRALGADRIDLWAISYGTHLGAAYLREHDDHVGRAVFAGFEGPDETVKLPSQTDAMLERFAQVIAADPEASREYPDFPATIRRVLERLEREPVTVTIAPGGDPVTLTFGAFPVRLMTGGMIADPDGTARLPALYRAMDEGQFEQIATLIATRLPGVLARMYAMPTAMDIASGVSPERLARVEREAEDSILGDALNFPMPHLVGVAPELDLGADFRAPLRSRTPVLFISGTLDGRTYPDSVREALSTLPNSRQLIVNNAGHNIYEADPRMPGIVLGWLRGGEAPSELVFAPPAIPVAPTSSAPGATTIQFLGDDGSVVNVVLRQDGMALINGAAPVAYTIDQTARSLCTTFEGAAICVVFEQLGSGVGFSTRYTGPTGGGTARILAE